MCILLIKDTDPLRILSIIFACKKGKGKICLQYHKAAELLILNKSHFLLESNFKKHNCFIFKQSGQQNHGRTNRRSFGRKGLSTNLSVTIVRPTHRQTDRKTESHDRLSVGQTNTHRYKGIHTDIKSNGQAYLKPVEVVDQVPLRVWHRIRLAVGTLHTQIH